MGVALFAMALSSSLVHMAAVHHGVCAEHGDLVEESAPVAHADIACAGLHTVPASGETDEHCPLTLPASHRDTAAPVVADAPRAAMHDAVVARAAPAEVARALAVLDVAPKHGPPVHDV